MCQLDHVIAKLTERFDKVSKRCTRLYVLQTSQNLTADNFTKEQPRLEL